MGVQRAVSAAVIYKHKVAVAVVPLRDEYLAVRRGVNGSARGYGNVKRPMRRAVGVGEADGALGQVKMVEQRLLSFTCSFYCCWDFLLSCASLRWVVPAV